LHAKLLLHEIPHTSTQGDRNMVCDFDQPIDRTKYECAKWHWYDEDVLPLWVADMDFRSPEPVIEALKERAEHGVFGYPITPPELYEVVVERMRSLYSWEVTAEELIFVPGVVTGFNLVCHAVGSPGDGVLLQTPVYTPMLKAPAGAEMTNDEMELTRQPDGSYEIDHDLFERTITDRTKVFILCNPHNPAGRVFRSEELERMAEICLRHNVLICSDEIHCDIVLEGNQHIPIASLAPEIADQTVTLIAPSKTFNIPGLKCSIAIVQNEELRAKLKETHTGLVHGVNIMGLVGALAAYKYGQPWLDELLEYLEANLEFLMQYVDQHLPGISMGRPEGTYLAWLSCHESAIAGNPHEFFLEQANVGLNDGAIYGQGGEGFVRLNFGCPRSTLSEALDRMGRALATLGEGTA
jgi:cystathionine beta-lyase